jgi:cytoskeletal protein CcmA (bactofilin family)
MFSNSKGSNIQTNKIDTLIGPSTNITGNINATGIIRIDGCYTGDIFSESDVIIGEGASIKGNITAINVSVSGRVDGNIKSNGTLEILSSANVVGDVEVFNFSIDRGAAFNGKCIMIPKEVKQLAAVND